MDKPYFIAEMGVNFYDTAIILGISPLEAAKLYIDEAATIGVDCVKFQSYKANTLASKNSPAYWDTTKEPTKSQFELFLKHDSFDEGDYRKLFEYTNEKGLNFTSTPFDYASADYLYDMVGFYKISSSDITNLPFIRYIGGKGKPVFLSVGASYLSEVDEAVQALRQAGCEDIALLHCVLSYPTTPDDANLSVITTLKNVYPELRVGYSDHVPPDDEMMCMTTAYMLGAQIIEKHFTLDKSLTGNDHYHAGDPRDFRKAIDNCIYLRRILGSPVKTVLPCEEIPRREARRSLVSARYISRGEIISQNDLVAKRPGTGIKPSSIDIVAGCCARRDIEKDTILTWDMFSGDDRFEV